MALTLLTDFYTSRMESLMRGEAFLILSGDCKIDWSCERMVDLPFHRLSPRGFLQCGVTNLTYPPRLVRLPCMKPNDKPGGNAQRVGGSSQSILDYQKLSALCRGSVRMQEK